MLLAENVEIRKVSIGSANQLLLIEAFLQGAVYSYIIARPNEWFSLRDLVGGQNGDWNGTPLQVAFEKHRSVGKSDEDAFMRAAIDVGWVLKNVLHKDCRRFAVEKNGLVNAYRWSE